MADETQSAAAPASAPTKESLDTLIGTWIENHVRNTPVSQATEAWNHLQAAIPKLRDALVSHFKL